MRRPGACASLAMRQPGHAPAWAYASPVRTRSGTRFCRILHAGRRSNRYRDLPGSSFADTDLLSISVYGDIAFRLNRMRSGTTVCRMDDPEVVAAIVAGDPAGL